jgi:lysine 6-dehydrogenase
VGGGKQTIVMECHARSNPGWHASAGDVDTACPASIAAQMITTGAIDKAGVWAPEDVIPPDLFFKQLRRRGITFASRDERGL